LLMVKRSTTLISNDLLLCASSRPEIPHFYTKRNVWVLPGIGTNKCLLENYIILI